VIAARLARLYEPNSAACPGEENCDTWRSSAPDAPVRCPSCPRLSGDGEKESSNDQQLLDRVECLRRQRDSGRQIIPLVKPLEWELLQIYDEQHDEYKRAHEMRVAHMFEMLNALLLRK